METFFAACGVSCRARAASARASSGAHSPRSDQWVPHFPASLQGIRPALTVAAGRYSRAVTEAEATTRARRVASLAEAALAQVEATHRAVEDVLAEVRDAQPVVPLETGSENGLDSARLVAIEMAVAGGSREEVGRHIRAAYDLADVEALLDDVFGAGA